MIDFERAHEIATGILPRIRRFPRNRAAQLATLAGCAKLLSSRCLTEHQAEDFCQSYQQPGKWLDMAHFESALNSATALDIPLRDQQNLAGLVHNSITEPMRCGDKLIGWCGRPYPAELILACENVAAKPLSEQAILGQRVISANTQIEAEIWQQILKLDRAQRDVLEVYARREFPQFIDKKMNDSPRWAMVMAFEEWRKTTCV